jgi:DNA-binding NarL/FixJ family response regulator
LKATRILTKTGVAMDLVEAAHEGSGGWQAWCERLQETARPLLSFEHTTTMIMRRAEHDYQWVAGASSIPGLADDYAVRLPQVPAADLDPFGRFQGHVGTMVSVLRGEAPAPALRGFVEMLAARDLLGLVAIADDHSFVISCPAREPIQLASADRQLLTQVFLHVEANLRLRLKPGSELAVLRPDGRVLHAAGLARRDADTRSHLTRHVATVERSRTRKQRQTSAGIDAWSALISGAWSLVERVDSDGARHYVVIETPRSRRLRSLSPVQMQVVELSARGLTGKAVAYALGITGGNVSKSLSEAAYKLGIRNRTELVRLASRLLDAGPARAPHVELTSAEHDVLELVRRGWTNAHIGRIRRRSEHTVANQVASLLRKLGVPSRRALATAAVTPALATLGSRNGVTLL